MRSSGTVSCQGKYCWVWGLQEEGRDCLGCWRVCVLQGSARRAGTQAPAAPAGQSAVLVAWGVTASSERSAGWFAQPSPREEWGSCWGGDRAPATPREPLPASPSQRDGRVDVPKHPGVRSPAQGLEPAPCPPQPVGLTPLPVGPPDNLQLCPEVGAGHRGLGQPGAHSEGPQG